MIKLFAVTRKGSGFFVDKTSFLEGGSAAVGGSKRKDGKMPKVNVSLQVLPCVPESDIYRVVDQVIKYIDQSKVPYEVGPMETVMEGELDILLDIVKKAQEICVQEGAARVVSVVKIDYKPGGVTMDEKICKYR